MSHSEMGNVGSITWVSHQSIDPITGTAIVIPQSSGSMIWNLFQYIVSYWWVIFLLAFGALTLFSTVMTDPVAFNPTKSPITFEIDGVSHTIPASNFITIKLAHGEHTITMSWKTMGVFDFGWIDGESIINPTLSELVVVEVLYVETSTSPEVYRNKLSKNTITIDSHPYTWEYELISKSPYIKKTWDYGVYEKSPEDINIQWSYEIKKELYTIAAFKEAFYADDEEMEEDVE